jgi:hypothetical protein
LHAVANHKVTVTTVKTGRFIGASIANLVLKNKRPPQMLFLHCDCETQSGLPY